MIAMRGPDWETELTAEQIDRIRAAYRVYERITTVAEQELIKSLSAELDITLGAVMEVWSNAHVGKHRRE